MDRTTYMGSALPRSLVQLTSACHSGTLTIQRDTATAQFVLARGRLISASCTGVPRLGERLRDAGWLSDEQLHAALRLQKRKPGHQPLGTILVALDLVPREAAEQAVTQQIAAVLAETTTWTEGRIFFSCRPPPADDMIWPPLPHPDIFLAGHALGRLGNRVADLFEDDAP